MALDNQVLALRDPSRLSRVLCTCASLSYVQEEHPNYGVSLLGITTAKSASFTASACFDESLIPFLLIFDVHLCFIVFFALD